MLNLGGNLLISIESHCKKIKTLQQSNKITNSATNILQSNLEGAASSKNMLHLLCRLSSKACLWKGGPELSASAVCWLGVWSFWESHLVCLWS